MIKSNINFIKRITVKRGLAFLTVFLLIGTLLLFNIFKLDVLMYSYYKDKAFDQLTTTSSLKASRGNIYDANLNVLATTATSWRIFVSPKEIKLRSSTDGKDHASTIANGLSEIFGTDSQALYKKICNSAVLDVTVEKKANEDEYKKVLTFITENHLEDLVFTEAQSARFYPEGSLAAHVLGFTGSDNQGLYGLEYAYNSTLCGKDGYYLYAKDANGKPLPGEYVSYIPPTDGNSIITTIDSYIQRELEGILETIRVTHNVQNRVTGIVMDVESGGILAMATTGAFDPNLPFRLDALSQSKLTNSGLSEESEEYKELQSQLMQIMWSNKAVSETYEPGSTFKIVTVAAALDCGAVNTKDTFSCPGYKTVGGWRIKCHKRTGHGSGFSLGYGLQMSCNPAMMTVAEKVGADRFYEYVKQFGYLEKTGIDLPSEASSIFHSKTSLGTTELATASFGQRFKVSIIGQLTAIAAVANGGILVTPYLVDKIIDQNGNVISEHQTVQKRRVISEQTAKTVSEILEAGVSGDGGAKNAYVEGYSVAAKTGTSEKFDILDANGNSYLRIGSTVAFAPSDEDGIAVIIVVDEPQSEVKYGSVVAAPYVSELLSIVLPYLDYISNAPSDIYTTENYSGMNISTVKKLLGDKGIKFEIIGNGKTVISQAPLQNIDINKSTSVIYLFTEKKESFTEVPNFIGLSLKEANILAAKVGLNIKIKGVTDMSKERILTVTAQSVAPFDDVPLGTVIVITALRTDFED